MTKIRADILLVEQGLFESRTTAKTSILAGDVRVGADHVVRNAAEAWEPDTVFIVTGRSPYVSRGAYKLLPALDRHLSDCSGRIALDLGASTGGFTDLLLQHGVATVYAVDVGHGQLHAKLRSDLRVICLDKTNARYLTRREIPDDIDVLAADLSFISLTKVLPAAAPLLTADAWIFILIKPQFEAARHEVGKGGVVKSEAVRERVVAEIREFAESALGWECREALPSPLRGPKGNQEYVGVFRSAGRRREIVE